LKSIGQMHQNRIMVEPTPPATIRIGNAERDAALTALGEHMRAGRLDPDEYGERAAKISVARYAHELAPLFEDLPSGAPLGASGPVRATWPQPAADTTPAAPSVGQPVDSPRGYPAAMLPEPGVSQRKRIIAVVPVLSVILFFAFGAAGGWGWSWIFFLLTPLVGALLYGDSRGGKDRSRNRR